MEQSHALIQILEPIFEPRFIFHSYACRAGKGSQRALSRFVAWARATKHVLKLDVRKFFPSIDHAMLKSRLRRCIQDPRVLQLCDLIIDGSNLQESVRHYFPGDDLFTPGERRVGLPIGNLTSQFFANLYLDAIDHQVKDRLRVRRYLRYADDLAAFHDDKLYLRELRAAIVEGLAGLRLRLNEGKSRIRAISEGVEYLGFVVRPDTLRLNQTAVRRQRRRMRALAAEYASGARSWSDVACSLTAWNAHARQGSTLRLRGDIFTAPFIRDA